MSVPPRTPAKLNPQFDCQGLWNFEGNLLDTSGLAPAADLTDRGGISPSFSYSQDYTGAKCLMSRGVNRGLESAAGIARLQLTGDVTIQSVVWFPTFGFDSFGVNLMNFEGTAGGSNPADNNIYAILVDGNNANRMCPRMTWEAAAGGSFFSVIDTDFTLDNGRWYHIVGVRDGTDARLYVNGALVKAESSVTATGGGTNSRVRIGEGTTVVQGLAEGTLISSAKISNRALTAGEIAQEFNRVRGAV